MGRYHTDSNDSRLVARIDGGMIYLHYETMQVLQALPFTCQPHKMGTGATAWRGSKSAVDGSWLDLGGPKPPPL